MKFGEKYELRESLTTGAVETFVANDKIRGQRVLVHILDCGLQQPNQPTVQWALDAFRRVAPEPAGLVLEAGRYSGTLYAYIVTQMPEKAALMNWVQHYQAQATDTHEILAPGVETRVQSEAPTADSSSEELVRPSTPFPPPIQTREALPTPPAPAVDIKKTKPDVDIKKTRLFAAPQPRVGASHLGETNLGGPNMGAPKPEPPRFPTEPAIIAPPAPVPPKPTPIVTTPPDFYRADLASKSAPPEAAAPAGGYNPKPGEFTSFFQGPFHGDEPTPVRGMSPHEIEPPRKSVGEFTAVFGSLSAEPPRVPSEMGAGTDDTESGLNVGWLNDSDIPRTPNTTAPPPIGGLPRAVSTPPPSPTVLPPQPPMSLASATPIFPTPLPPKPAVPPVAMPPIPIPAPPVVAPPLPTLNPADVARRAFSNPGIEPITAPPAVSTQPPMANGPSAYTQVIKRQYLPAAAAATNAEPAPLAAKAPALPKIAPPAAPKVAAPEAPKLDAPPAPTISYWPLVLTLTVLFFIAVLLVLYFVLKH